MARKHGPCLNEYLFTSPLLFYILSRDVGVCLRPVPTAPKRTINNTVAGVLFVPLPALHPESCSDSSDVLRD